MYKDAQRVAGSLLGEPFPPEAEPDRNIPGTFIIRTGMVRLVYRVVGEEVDVAGVWPNS